VDDLDLVAVGLLQPHALAAARLVHGLDARGAGQLGQALQVILALGVIGKADEFGAALVHGVQVMVAVGAAHVERVGRTLGPDHAEMGEKLLHLVEIGRFHAGEGKFSNLDRYHDVPPGT